MNKKSDYDILSTAYWIKRLDKKDVLPGEQKKVKTVMTKLWLNRIDLIGQLSEQKLMLDEAVSILKSVRVFNYYDFPNKDISEGVLDKLEEFLKLMENR